MQEANEETSDYFSPAILTLIIVQKKNCALINEMEGVVKILFGGNHDM
jgi:hypothetical protein